MKKIFLLLITCLGLLPGVYAQRVKGTIKTANAVSGNEVIISIKPTAAMTCQMTNLILSVQIPVSVGARPVVSFSNLQPTLFQTWTQLDADQGDGFYTWGFNCAAPGSSNIEATSWTTAELDVLKITFAGPPVPLFTARLCHYLDGGTNAVGPYAIFYVETNLAMVNGGVLSDWGSLFYGTGASNGAVNPGNTGVTNALYSYTTAPNIALPTKFLSFIATKKDDNAVLTWTVDNEETNIYFDVQRSLDGRTFTDFTRVNALRNGRSSNTYTTPDANISRLGSRIIYYRIKQTEASGDVLYSEVRQVNLDKKNFDINLYPNPVVHSTKLVIDAPVAGKAIVVIRDITGKTLQQINMDFVKGINQKNLDASMLPAGDYNVTVIGEKFNQTIKMTKTN